MVQLRSRLRLAQKPHAHLVAVGEVRRQHLDRDETAELDVAAAIHDAHSAAANLGVKLIALTKSGDGAGTKCVAHRDRDGPQRRPIPDSRFPPSRPWPLSFAISSATYIALSTSLASSRARSATCVICCSVWLPAFSLMTSRRRFSSASRQLSSRSRDRSRRASRSATARR